MWIVVNVMPSPTTSDATTRVQASSAAFEATYALKRGGLVWTPIEEMFTMWPNPRSRMGYLGIGAIRLTMGLLPHMRERGSGHIVNVSSIGAQTNPPRFSAYVASKAALDAFTRVVSSETIGDNVTFTTIHMEAPMPRARVNRAWLVRPLTRRP